VLVVAGVLAFAVVIVVGNTSDWILEARRDEILVMKLMVRYKLSSGDRSCMPDLVRPRGGILAWSLVEGGACCSRNLCGD